MGITKEEWGRLKEEERYGMIARLFVRMDELETVQKNLVERLSDVENSLDNMRC